LAVQENETQASDDDRQDVDTNFLTSENVRSQISRNATSTEEGVKLFFLASGQFFWFTLVSWTL